MLYGLLPMQPLFALLQKYQYRQNASSPDCCLLVKGSGRTAFLSDLCQRHWWAPGPSGKATIFEKPSGAASRPTVKWTFVAAPVSHHPIPPKLDQRDCLIVPTPSSPWWSPQHLLFKKSQKPKRVTKAPTRPTVILVATDVSANIFRALDEALSVRPTPTATIPPSHPPGRDNLMGPLKQNAKIQHKNCGAPKMKSHGGKPNNEANQSSGFLSIQQSQLHYRHRLVK